MVLRPAARALAITLALTTRPVAAHEYWLEPLDYRLAPGAPIEVEVRVGEHFGGVAYPFVPDAYPVAMLRHDGASAPIRTTWERTPSIAQSPLGPGVNRLVVGSEASSLTYDDFAAFETFLAFAGQPELALRHRERNLPDAVSELYLRYAKALVLVEGVEEMAPDEAVDQPEGLRHEWVALDNPYSRAPGRPLRFRLLFEGAPAADFPVQIFEKADGEARQIDARTDAEGIYRLPENVSGEIMLNAVRILPESDAPEGPHWRSLWSSMTFEHQGSPKDAPSAAAR